MGQPDFDDQLRDLFRHTADTVSSSDDLTQRIQRRIHQDRMVQNMPNSIQARRVTIGSISIVAIVVLIAGMLVYLHAHHTPSQIGSASISTPSIVSQVTAVTSQGITLQLLQAYSDPLGTEVKVAISGTNQQMHNPELNDPTLTLTDSAGKSFTFTNGMTSGEGGYFGTDPRYQVGTFDYLPLPVQQLRGPLHATFVVHHITLDTGVKPPSLLPPVGGTWQCTFALNPVAGETYTLNTPAVVNQGIGIQVQSMEVAPPNQTELDSGGGVRILLTITGLPGNTLIQSLDGWYPYSTPPLSGGTQCSPNAPPACSAPPNPPRALLTLPGFAIHAGNGVSFYVSSQGSSSAQTVGADGVSYVELLYPGQGSPDGTAGTLIISNLQIVVSSGNQTSVKETLPTWTFTLPFH